jgi:hypothetical protein
MEEKHDPYNVKQFGKELEMIQKKTTREKG